MKNNPNKKLLMLYTETDMLDIQLYLRKTDIFKHNDMALFSWLSFYCISTL